MVPRENGARVSKYEPSSLTEREKSDVLDGVTMESF